MPKTIPGPDGEFLLSSLINPGVCPECGKMSKDMWFFFPDNPKGDKYLSLTSIVVGCDDCAKRSKKS